MPMRHREQEPGPLLDTSQDILEAGITSVLLLGDADWCTGDLGGVGPAVFLDALAMGPAEFDIDLRGGETSSAKNCEPRPS